MNIGEFIQEALNKPTGTGEEVARYHSAMTIAGFLRMAVLEGRIGTQDDLDSALRKLLE